MGKPASPVSLTHQLFDDTGDIERATEAGPDDYLTKPIDRKALVNLVKNLLQSRQK